MPPAETELQTRPGGPRPPGGASSDLLANPSAGTAIAERRNPLPERLAPLVSVSPGRTDVQRATRVTSALLIVLVLGQRLVVPVGANPVPFTLLATYATVALLALMGFVKPNLTRVELYVVSVCLMTGVSWLAALHGSVMSLTSLLLLILLYLPFTITIRADLRSAYRALARTFVRLMMVLSAVGAVELAAQFAGVWSFTDYLEMLVGPNYLVQDFNVANPLSWDSPIVKAQAFVFLEPSMFSQFCALGIIIALLLRAPAWQPLLLGLGMASAISGTGILLLVVGTILVILRRPELVKPSYIIAGVLGLAVVLSLPVADYLLARRDETSQQGSSGNMRFIQPYTEVNEGLQADRLRYLIGGGPGSSERVLLSARDGRAGVAVVYTIPSKVPFEYGFIAGTAFLAFLLVCLFRAPPTAVLPGTICFMIFFLSGSLLQANTILLAWLLTSFFARK